MSTRYAGELRGILGVSKLTTPRGRRVEIEIVMQQAGRDSNAKERHGGKLILSVELFFVGFLVSGECACERVAWVVRVAGVGNLCAR
jgi:hypothetical protein